MDLLKGLLVIIIIVVVSIILTHDEECASYARENARDKWHGEDLFHTVNCLKHNIRQET